MTESTPGDCRSFIRYFTVTVCAPEAEQSAIGHAITLSKPLRVKKIAKNGSFYGYAVNGTPADCVKIAIRCLLKERPQMVISGINHGPNLGSDIMYSGTVSAATEGTILGIPSIAVSIAAYEKQNFRCAAKAAVDIARLIAETGLPDATLLNVNVPALPARQIKGIKITKQGRSLYKEDFVKRTDPRGRTYYWLTGKVKWVKKPADSDIKAVEEKYISITPLRLDLTEYGFIEQLKTFKFNQKQKSTDFSQRNEC